MAWQSKRYEEVKYGAYDHLDYGSTSVDDLDEGPVELEFEDIGEDEEGEEGEGPFDTSCITTPLKSKRGYPKIPTSEEEGEHSNAKLEVIPTLGFPVFGDIDNTKDLLKKMFEDEPPILPRPVGVFMASKNRKVVAKFYGENNITQFHGEIFFTKFVEAHRKTTLPAALPLLGSAMFSLGELLSICPRTSNIFSNELSNRLRKEPPTKKEEDLASTENKDQEDLVSSWQGMSIHPRQKSVSSHMGDIVGVIIMEYLPDSFSLTEFIIQRRHAKQFIYERELHFILATVVGFITCLQALDPCAKHHDLKPDNILIQWNPGALTQKPPEEWRRTVVAKGVIPVEKKGSPQEIFTITMPHPPGLTVKVIDYGLAWKPDGPVSHITDSMITLFGVTSRENRHYDCHTLLNGIRDLLISRPEISNLGWCHCERKLVKNITDLYGAHLLGFGMAIITHFSTSGRGGIVLDQNSKKLGSQPLVQTRMSAFPRLLSIFPGEQEANVQAAAVIAVQRKNVDMLKGIVDRRYFPKEAIEDLFSNRMNDVMHASGYMNLNCDKLPIPLVILMRNALGLLELEVTLT